MEPEKRPQVSSRLCGFSTRGLSPNHDTRCPLPTGRRAAKLPDGNSLADYTPVRSRRPTGFYRKCREFFTEDSHRRYFGTRTSATLASGSAVRTWPSGRLQRAASVQPPWFPNLPSPVTMPVASIGVHNHGSAMLNVESAKAVPALGPGASPRLATLNRASYYSCKLRFKASVGGLATPLQIVFAPVRRRCRADEWNRKPGEQRFFSATRSDNGTAFSARTGCSQLLILPHQASELAGLFFLAVLATKDKQQQESCSTSNVIISTSRWAECRNSRTWAYSVCWLW